jgi:glycosyltransferase involved in cell wall biosynthesis
MSTQLNPGVSVILPILNEERDLSECISAILQQKYDGKLEVILALGPSTDNTNQIAKSLAQSDSRIKLVDNPTGKTGIIGAKSTDVNTEDPSCSPVSSSIVPFKTRSKSKL